MYDEFGMPEVVKIPEATKLPEVTGELHLGFTGYMRDDISDTLFAQGKRIYARNRAIHGRDILKGIVEQPRRLNEYAYCHNDPVGFVDLNGMDAILVNKEIEGVPGIEHMGDSFKILIQMVLLLLGRYCKGKAVYGYFNGSRSDVTAYLKREDDMGNNNKEYHEAVYVKGDFSKSVKEGQRLQEFYNKNFKKHEGKSPCPNKLYNLQFRNCTQVTMYYLCKAN